MKLNFDVTNSWHLAFVVVSAVGLLATHTLFGLYSRHPRGLAARTRRWAAAWDFTMTDLGGFSWSKLAVASMLGLFLEMLMIRWISSEVRVFAYFKNFVLIACFLGFGLGCALCRRRINLAALLAPVLLLVLLVELPWPGLRALITRLPSLLGSSSEVHMWGVPMVSVGWHSLRDLAAALLIVVPMFALIALLFVPYGQMVGWYLENARRGLWGYTVNVIAGLVGILLYTLLCFYFQPPWVWFAAAAVMLMVVLWHRRDLVASSATVLLGCAVLVGVNTAAGWKTYWSPYQKLSLRPTTTADKRVISYLLTTNDTWYQQILDLRPQAVAELPTRWRGNDPLEWNAYNVPYRFYARPPSVLVLGAGMGNDVAAALRNGAGRVVAVEIDPLILKLGRELHFEQPYQSARVKQVVDDARSYIQNADEQFDLIMFSLLDSHTTASHYSNIRIDNYVYTREALTAARRMLRPNGLFIIKFQVDTPWIAGRLKGLLENAFHSPPLQLQSETEGYTTSGRFFITGSQERIAAAMADPGVQEYVRAHGNFEMAPATLTTDDWPYFYQHEPGLPLSVIVISVSVVLLGLWFVRGSEGQGAFIGWHFFFLGAGFLLLEAQIISKMALLFGTTWVVNSVVISGLLVVIVCANFLVGWWPRVPVWLGYVGIFACMAVAYLTPLETFFFSSVWLKATAAAAVLCLPVLFAGIVFARSFTLAKFSGEALGSNLLGALVGGVLESLSFWTGLKSLLIVAALLYLASALALRREVRRANAGPDVVFHEDKTRGRSHHGTAPAQ